MHLKLSSEVVYKEFGRIRQARTVRVPQILNEVYKFKKMKQSWATGSICAVCSTLGTR